MRTIIAFMCYCAFLSVLMSWSACQHPIQLPECVPMTMSSETETGNYWLSEVLIAESCLFVQLSHGGSCAEHSYELRWNGALAESMPPQAFLVLWHGDPGDPCDAIIQQNLFFDLGPLLAEPYEQIIVHVSGWEESLLLNDN